MRELIRKILIDETNRLSEQEPSLDRMVDLRSMGPDRYNEYKKQNLLSDKESEYFFDILLDGTAIAATTVSAIPHLKWLRLVGFTIDIVHTLSYFVRAHNTQEKIDRLDYVFNGLITLMTMKLPFGRGGFRAWYITQKHLLTRKSFKFFFKNMREESILLILFAMRLSKETVRDTIVGMNKKVTELILFIDENFPNEGDVKDKIIESLEYVKSVTEEALNGLENLIENPEFMKLINDDGEIIIKEDLEYSHVTDASPESDEYEMSEGWEGVPKKKELSPQVEEFLFDYWGKNGTELTPCRYIGINCLEYEQEIDKLKIKFYGGYDKALELAKKEIGVGKKRHISSGGYEMDVTPLAFGVISRKTHTPDENPYDVELGMKVRITNGSVQFLDRDDDYRWDFDELFMIDHGIDVDDLYEITTEIGMTAKEPFLDIVDKYGLFMTGMDHNYKNAWRMYG